MLLPRYRKVTAGVF